MEGRRREMRDGGVWFGRLLGVAAVGLVVTQGLAGAPAETPSFVVDYGQAGTVQIEAKASKKQGSGFFVSSDGAVLTCEHVVAQDEKVTVKTAGKQVFEGTVVARDTERDLAVVKVPVRNVPCQVLGDSSALHAGESVLAVGSPLGLDGTVTSGVVSSPSRKVGKQTLIQTDVPVNPGLSGGPLLDGKGQVVGVIAGMVKQAQDVGFAVPINSAAEVLGKAKVAVSVVPSNKKLAFQKAAVTAAPAKPEREKMVTLWPLLAAVAVVVGLVVALVFVLRRRSQGGGAEEVQIAFRPGSGAGHAVSAPAEAENLEDVDIELK